MFQRIHRDTYSVILAVLILIAIIAVLLLTLNPIH
jgi:hypothetical protein